MAQLARAHIITLWSWVWDLCHISSSHFITISIKLKLWLASWEEVHVRFSFEEICDHRAHCVVDECSHGQVLLLFHYAEGEGSTVF